MPLKAGYSQTTIRANVAQLKREGYPHNRAIAAAHENARRSYWKRYPAGFLPPWIYPDHETGRVNPRLGQEHELHRNPAPRGADATRAASLYRRFVGRDADKAKMINVNLPKALVAIGRISVIQYVAERDGKVYEFRHPFKASSRPHLAVTPDGKQVLMLGGAWTFTQDGFVDK